MKTTVWLLSIALLAACQSTPPKPSEVTIPVTVATAQNKDMPVRISAVGIVQPLQSVAIRPLVAGQLTRVWFREGDAVHRGQLLFSIDPRPYQAALRQAQAILARDEALLRNAEAERVRYASLDGIVSHEQYDAIDAAAEAARAVVAADRAAVDDTRALSRFTRATSSRPTTSRRSSSSIRFRPSACSSRCPRGSLPRFAWRGMACW
jgi:multidrug efflux system membrane fusion protein